MKKEDAYLSFIAKIKATILQSRYNAARLVNKEMLILYFFIGEMLSEKIATEKWGAKVIERMSLDIQQEFPGIKGFSVQNLKNMRQFYEAYHFLTIGQTMPAQIDNALIKNKKKQIAKPSLTIGQALPVQIDPTSFIENFLQVGFTHHILLMQKCKNIEERIFYLQKIIENQWSSRILEYHLEENLYKNQGKIQTNFSKTLPEKLQKKALQVFKDEYLLNHINVQNEEDELAVAGNCP